MEKLSITERSLFEGIFLTKIFHAKRLIEDTKNRKNEYIINDGYNSYVERLHLALERLELYTNTFEKIKSIINYYDSHQLYEKVGVQNGKNSHTE